MLSAMSVRFYSHWSFRSWVSCNNGLFQDDNARTHRGRVINDFIRQQNIQRLEWPANSPDLNPLEQIWDEVERRVYRLNPPQTLPKLRQRLMQDWVNIPQPVIRECVQSMRNAAKPVSMPVEDIQGTKTMTCNQI